WPGRRATGLASPEEGGLRGGQVGHPGGGLQAGRVARRAPPDNDRGCGRFGKRVRLGALNRAGVHRRRGRRDAAVPTLPRPGFDPAKKWPVVYLVHGGPQGAWEDSWSYRWNPQVWAAKGYVVVMPNPRGSTGFGQKFVDEISGDWGGKCYRDLVAGLDHVTS